MTAPLVVCVADGETVPYTPGSAVAAGDVIVQADLVGVAVRPIAANVQGALSVAGIFKFPKGILSTSALAAGALAYWKAGSSIATGSSGDGKLIGKVVTAATAGATTVNIRLDQ